MSPDDALAPTFDYRDLAKPDLDLITRNTEAIRELMRRAAGHVIEIGRRLLEVKDRLPHGRFGDWLRAEFEMEPRLAQNLMNVARRFKSETVSHLPITPAALYMLAAPSTPDRARAEAVQRAEAGERIGKAAAGSIVTAHRADRQPRADPPIDPDTALAVDRGDAWEGDDGDCPLPFAGLVPAPEAEPEKVELLNDAYGQPVPDALVPEAKRHRRLRAIADATRKFKGQWEDAGADGVEVGGLFDALIGALTRESKFVICSCCAGLGRDGGCEGGASACAAKGWLTSNEFDRLPEQQKRHVLRFRSKRAA
jgi:hypothetical protein